MALPTRSLAAVSLHLLLLTAARGDLASDLAECARPLSVLLPCLPFVQGEAPARAPTPECCSAGRAVVGGSFRCLCVLVKDHDRAELGFKVNVSRAVALPAFCNFPANVSLCPKLLSLPFGSPSAREFFDLEAQILQYTKEKTKANGSVNARSSIPSGSRSVKRSLMVGNGGVVQACLVMVMVLLWSKQEVVVLQYM